MNVVVWISVCWRLKAAIESKSQGIWKNQFSPAPSKIAWYVLSGFLPVVTRTTRPPITNAISHRQERRDEPARPLREGETLAEALLRVG